MKAVPVKKFTKPLQILKWLHEAHALTDHQTTEWCKIFEVPAPDCKLMLEKHGDDVIPLPQFIRWYVSRDLKTRPTFAPERERKVYRVYGDNPKIMEALVHINHDQLDSKPIFEDFDAEEISDELE